MRRYLSDLPLEVIGHIMCLAIHQADERKNIRRRPLSVLVLNSQIYHYLVPLLYSDLNFTSVDQISSFASCTTSVPYIPRSISVALSGATADHRKFVVLHAALKRCTTSANQPVLILRSLLFCFNSHLFDPNLCYLYEALTLVRPLNFSWTGPDPDHHFSIAIVAEAATMLFRAFSLWTDLRVLVLTNITFPIHIDQDLSTGAIITNNTAIDFADTLNNLPLVESIYLGQVTFLDPAFIARLVKEHASSHLQVIDVTDAYAGSIWGRRVRLDDIVKHAESCSKGDDLWAREIRRIVRCNCKTERIEGGDRMG